MTEGNEKPQQADDSADRAVAKVFAIMGVDVDDPKQVSRFQRDLRFSGDLRRKVDAGASTIAKTALTMLVAGGITAIWWAITGRIGGGQ